MARKRRQPQPDDTKLQLEQIAKADDERREVPEGETEDQRIERQSALLRPELRARVDASIVAIGEQVPGLTAVETAKFLATRAGRDALKQGKVALARVDAHLQSITEERNPLIGKSYGVYGSNPVSFAGVLRALALSSGENVRLAALPEGHAERRLLFSGLVEREVEQAFDKLAAIIGDRLGSRAALSKAFTVKGETLDEARKVITAVRNHLHANLPDRKQDDDLRDYGFTPHQPGGRRRGGVVEEEADDGEDDEDLEP